MDFHKINALITDDYISNNHPIGALSDASQYLACKKTVPQTRLLSSLSLPTDGKSMVSRIACIYFASTTFAYCWLAQGLSRVLSAFSRFMREYFDTVIKADQCAQYAEDIGIAANTTEQLIKSIRERFKRIRKAGLKLTIEKRHFGVTQVKFLGRTILSNGIAPQDHKVKTFLS